MEVSAVHSNKKIGEWLLHLGLLTKRQLDAAMEMQAANPEMKLGAILISKGYITQQELDETLAVQEVLKGRTALKDYPISPKILSLLPEQFSLQYEVLPLAQIAMRLLVATADGRNFEAIDKITLHTGLIVISVEVPRLQLLEALGKIYNRNLLPPDPGPAAPHGAPLPPMPAPAAVAAAPGSQVPPPRSSAEANNDALISELVNSVLEETVQLMASELHLTPHETLLEVRCRRDGIMRKILEIPKKFESLFLKRLQANVTMAGEARGTGDRVFVRVHGQTVGMRLSTAPSLWGDRLKIDLTYAGQEVKPLGMLGMDPESLLEYKQLLRGMSGVVLLVGPRRSGKATTLTSTLGYLDKVTNHVVSIAEPGTQVLPGVTQIPLHRGLALEGAIDQSMAQSPDILVLGRLATAGQVDAALRASLQGVLVIGTLDAASVGGAIAQLIAMGTPPYLLTASLRGVLNQRLVRRNCPQCATEYNATPQESRFLGLSPGAPLQLTRGVGCDHCHQTGYAGLVGVFEMMRVTPVMGELINAPQLSLPAIQTQMREGATSLLESAKQKIITGHTSIFEVLRVLGDVISSEHDAI